MIFREYTRRLAFSLMVAALLAPLFCHGQFSVRFFSENKSSCFVISLTDIEKVDWQNQLFYLSSSGVDNVSAAHCIFESFEVILNDSIVYTGKMESAEKSSIALKEPAILFLDKQLFVDRSFRFAIFYKGKNPDVRFNQKLFDYLKLNNKF